MLNSFWLGHQHKHNKLKGYLMGSLIFLTTPIGNLKDITLNVLEKLKEGSIFYVEDTRSFKNLLTHYGISFQTKFIDSFHEQSPSNKVKKIINYLKNGEDVYYCSEAGSPCVSDPGVALLSGISKEVEGLKLISYSGVSAINSALESSGVMFDTYSFLGFFPREKGKLINILERCKSFGGVHVFFESPKRVIKTLEWVLSVLDVAPEEIYVCRELTKKFQTIVKLNKSDSYKNIADIVEKGEFVLIFKYEGQKSFTNNWKEIEKCAQSIVSGDVRTKSLSKLLGLITGENSKSIYSKLEKNN